jgi:superfamily II DNA or RNA helicase
MITIRVGNVNLVLQGEIPLDIADEIRETLSYVVPGHEYTKTFKRNQERLEAGGKAWDGTKTLARRSNSGLACPTGLYSYIKDILKRNDIPYQIFDERPTTVKTPGWSTEGFSARDYQQKPIDTGLNRQRGVMQAATGAGKTEMIVKMVVEAGSFPSIIYVNSCDLLEQTYDRFMKYVRYNGEPVAIGRVGAGHFDPQPISIITVQTAEIALTGEYNKYMFDDYDPKDKTELSTKQRVELVDLIKQAQFVYVDECHHVSCDTIQNVLNNSHGARYRFGGSASPWRDDGLDIMIEAAFGRRFCSITASFLIKSGYLVRPTIVFNHFRQKLGPTATFQAHYKKYIVENEARNEFIANKALHYIDLRLPTIILVKWSTHAEILAKLIGDQCEVLTSTGKKKKTPKKRKFFLEKMRNRELMCIIATTLLDEGVDVPAASAGIFAGGGKSSTRELQRVGRFIRKDPNDPKKDMAYIEEFYEHTRWLNDHAARRKKILETEPEFDIFDKMETMEI